MAKDNYVGITETGDIAFDLNAFDHLHGANVIITKRLTDRVIAGLAAHRDCCILHLTVTGWGGTKVEPLVPATRWSRNQLEKLLESDFPVSQVVLRIDPIILTEEGMQHVNEVLDAFKDSGITRYRISFIDMYKHTKGRFLAAGLALPHDTFHAPLELRKAVLQEFIDDGKKHGYTVETCGEPGIDSVPCVSQKDIDILGLTREIILKGNANQRDACGCPANKKQILTRKPGRCGNRCLYCYWKDDN